MKTISESNPFKRIGQRKMVVLHGVGKGNKKGRFQTKKTSRTMHLRKIRGEWVGAIKQGAWTFADYGKDLPAEDIGEVK